MAYRRGYEGGYAEVGAPPTGTVYSYANVGVSPAQGSESSAYSYSSVGPAFVGNQSALAYSYSNIGYAKYASKDASAYSYFQGVLALAAKSDTIYSYGASVPGASPATSAYSFGNSGVDQTGSSSALGYGYHHAGISLVADPSAAAYSYEAAGLFFTLTGEAAGYSYANTGIGPATAAPAVTGYSYEHVGIGGTSAKADSTAYGYSNTALGAIASPSSFFSQYQNVGFAALPESTFSAFWQYENVGFSEYKTWHGWGVPIHSDPVELDSPFYMYENVFDPTNYSVPYGSPGWRYTTNAAYDASWLELGYDDSSWSAGRGYFLGSSLGSGFAQPPQGNDGSSGQPYSDKGVGTITGGGYIWIRRIIPAGVVTQAILDCTGYMAVYTKGGEGGRSTGNRSVSGIPVPSNAATVPWVVVGLSYAGNGNPPGLDIQIIVT